MHLGSAGFKAIAFFAVVLLLLFLNAWLGLSERFDAAYIGTQLNALVSEKLVLALAFF